MDRSRGSRPALRAPARCARSGGCGPPPLRSAARARAVPRGLRPGARVPIRGPPGPLGSFAALRRHKRYARWARWALFRPACGPPLRRGPFPCAGPAAACAPAPASRLRSGALRPAAFGLAVAGPAGCPPAPPLGAGRPRSCGLPVPLAGPVCLRPRPRCAAGSLFGRPCCAWPWALCSAWPRRVPPSRALRASGPGCSRPGAVPGCRPAFLPPPPGVGCAPAPARACCASRRRFRGGVGSPLRPPAPPPPLGAPGSARLVPSGLSAPRWGLLFAALPAGPPPARRPAARALGAVDSPKIVNRGLHAACEPPFSPAALPLSGFRQDCPSAHRLSRNRDRKCGLDLAGREFRPPGLTIRLGRGTLYWQGSFRSFGGRPSRGVRGRPKAAWSYRPGGFSYALLISGGLSARRRPL